MTQSPRLHRPVNPIHLFSSSYPSVFSPFLSQHTHAHTHIHSTYTYIPHSFTIIHNNTHSDHDGHSKQYVNIPQSRGARHHRHPSLDILLILTSSLPFLKLLSLRVTFGTLSTTMRLPGRESCCSVSKVCPLKSSPSSRSDSSN